jgi:23S rRNA pseudouridine2605 synthase
MLNKPRGYVTTTSDELGRANVTELVADAPDKVYPVGRLDKNSEGLLLFTNDGDFANTVMHPRNNISKTYRATVRPDITEAQLIKLSSGVTIDGQKTLPAAVHVLEREPGRVVLQITIHEGRNRQIRKMCEAVGLTVARLKRISVGPLKLGMLKPGDWRELTAEELKGLRGAAAKGGAAGTGQGTNPH